MKKFRDIICLILKFLKENIILLEISTESSTKIKNVKRNL